MQRIQTKCFGKVDYSSESIFHFPQGVPGFENETDFVFIKLPDAHPLMFMQSVKHSQICFILLPILSADPNYQLRLTDEDLTALRLPSGRHPRIGEEVLCAALVCAPGKERPHPTLNLLAPIVVNLKERVGMQAIQSQSGYSHRHPFLPTGLQMEAALCS